mmetsp:Transcript_41727/g.124786  ORF Transcript_41727/g.124786 Transcript_41727/m.124786 type:complete len:112 (+) Transcript_41727:287-622(+)
MQLKQGAPARTGSNDSRSSNVHNQSIHHRCLLVNASNSNSSSSSSSRGGEGSSRGEVGVGVGARWLARSLARGVLETAELAAWPPSGLLLAHHAGMVEKCAERYNGTCPLH